MDQDQYHRIREVLHDVRHWRISLDTAEGRIDEIVGEVTPTTPPDTGTTLPRARGHRTAWDDYWILRTAQAIALWPRNE